MQNLNTFSNAQVLTFGVIREDLIGQQDRP